MGTKRQGDGRTCAGAEGAHSDLQSQRRLFWNVRPGAKAVNAQAAVALPVSDGAAGVRAVVGIAFPDEREFTKAELDDLTAAASTVPNA